MRTWDLKQESFFQLLERLDADSALAGEGYEKLRSKLIFFFDRKGCRIPNELCDETINRVAQKIGGGCEIPDLLKFSLGVARMVLLEYWNDPKKDWEQLDEQLAVSDIDREDFEEQRLECMKKCLQSLSPEDRELIVKNCTLDKNGKLEMAATMGLTMNALRLRVFRIRAGLRECCEKCIRARKEVTSRRRVL
jgi:DNA-directed RNA polymerase specialized sigma24 family protein